MILTLLLLGCKQNDEPKDALQDKIRAYQSQSSAFIHDGSTGGAYGIGQLWSLKILPHTYETYTENIAIQESSEEISLSAKYEWVKEGSKALETYPKVETKFVVIPAQYETVTERIEVKPARVEYYITEPIYNPNGTLKIAGTVKSRNIQAEKKRVSRRVVKSPARVEERPVARRNGYVRILKKPATIKSRNIPAVVKTITKSRVRHPQRLVILRPDGEIAHIFDTIEDFTAFTDNLK